MTDSTCTPPSGFTRPFFLLALATILTNMAINWLPKYGFSLPVPHLLAFLPLIPAVFFMLALTRAIQKMDELQRRICLEAIFIAFMFTLLLTLCFAGLERAAIYRVSANDLGTFMMGSWVGAYFFTAWRYR
jgi:hypothetical protein